MILYNADIYIQSDWSVLNFSVNNIYYPVSNNIYINIFTNNIAPAILQRLKCHPTYRGAVVALVITDILRLTNSSLIYNSRKKYAQLAS